MEDGEWIEEMVSQRIEALLKENLILRQDGKEQYAQAMKRAEAVLKSLPPEDWDAMDQFQSMVTRRHSEDSAYLYVCGIQDGIRAMKYINRL